MDFELDRQDQAFREQVNGLMKSLLPEDWDERCFYWPGAYGNVPLSETEFQETQLLLTKAFGKKGWLTLGLPEIYGGKASTLRQAIVDDVSFYYGIPVRGNAPLICAPTIAAVGSEAMKKEWLPRISLGEVSFWLGYSEPNAGSDIASVETIALESGDYYVIHGQKTWSSAAHVCDYGWVLARTDRDAPKHKSLTLFIIDNNTPGITIRPIINICGNHSFNEVFFDNVKVPKKNIVGEVNHAFKYLMLALEHERLMCGGPSGFKRIFEKLVAYAKETKVNGRILTEKKDVRSKFAELAADIEILYCNYWRTAWMMDHGEFAGYHASMLKLFSTELSRKLADLALEVMGEIGTLMKGSPWTPLQGRMGMGYVDSISGPLGAGSSEIQRSIIATRGLGLPNR
jgi:3-oxocholest-4-en-26-oyl-CoA dehydrogenase alpha subunit